MSSRKRNHQHGYTAVEVMMAMTVLLIGSIGVMAMQRAAVQGNTDAREMDVANSIARGWIERLERDATLWTQPTVPQTPPPNLPNAVLVNENLGLNGTMGQWYLPQARSAANGSQNDTESASFDILGQDVDTSVDPTGVRYCVNLRLTALTVDQTLIRAEVRVFWPRNLTIAPDPNYCSGAPPAQLDTDTAKYHFVYAVTALRQNVQP